MEKGKKKDSRFVILVENEHTDDIVKDFDVVSMRGCLYDLTYSYMMIQPKTKVSWSIDEMLFETGAAAIHEEFSNVIAFDDTFEDIKDLYGYKDGMREFAAEMLTDKEKLVVLCDYIDDNIQDTIDYNKIEVITIENKSVNAINNVKALFNDDIYRYCYDGQFNTIEWGDCVPEELYFLIKKKKKASLDKFYDF